MQRREENNKPEMNETIVNIRRVAKTVKGGRNMRFSVTVVVGDREGHVGVGLGKAQEIPEAVRKATEDAKKKLITDTLVSSGQAKYSSCRLQKVLVLSLVPLYVRSSKWRV